MKSFIFCILLLSVLAGCDYLLNKHTSYANGVVVIETRSMAGVTVEVDTTGDGVTDIEAEVVGQEMTHRFQRGDTVSVDIRQSEHFASLIAEGEKSKQDTLNNSK